MSYLLGFVTGAILVGWAFIRYGSQAYNTTGREFLATLIRSSGR